MIALFDYQQQGIYELRKAYAQGANAPLLVLPTGGGKTVCFTYMASEAYKKGKRVLLLAHRRELVGQISAALKRWNVAHGVITPKDKPTNHPVQVAMVQTLVKRVPLDKTGRFKFDFVIIDEAHHATRDSTWGQIIAHNAGAKLLGVSATPIRLDGKGLGVTSDGFFDHIVVGPSAAALVESGRLCPPVVYAPETQINLDGVKKRGGDYVTGQLAKAVDKQLITGDAVAHYRKYCDRLPAIAFTVTTEHAAHVADEFKAAGYQAGVLTGQTLDKERAQMIRDLGNGKLQVLASCNVVSEGTDIPAVVAAILLRPTASYALAMQQIGRALRTMEGKTRAIILDHAGNTLRHGLPTDDVNWSLNGVDRGKVKLKKCPNCKAVVAYSVKKCPGCGKVFYVAAADQDADMVTRDLPAVNAGELVEMSPERLRQLRRERFRAEAKCQSVAELAAIGVERGYKFPQQWAAKRFSELGRVNVGLNRPVMYAD